MVLPLLGVEDAATNVTTFAYDALDRRTAETDSLTKTIGYAYDAASRVTAVTDRQGRVRAFGYDAADQRTSEVWKTAGGSVVQTQTFGYDAAGRLTSATDPDGNYTMAYDAADRTTAVTEPFGVSLTMGYDAAGNRTSVTDSGGATQTSVYDLADRLTSRRLDTANSDVRADYAYTSRGQVSSVTRYSDLAGTTKVGSSSYGYDDGMRVTSITHANASGTTLASFTYAYDLSDRVTATTENGSAVTYGYDAADQVTSDNGVSQSYDGTGNRTNSGYTTTTGNRLGSDGTWSYTYNDDGQITGKSKSGESWSYSYDHAGQLVSATNGTSTVNYAYDAFGNRIERSEGTSTTRYAYDGWDTAKPMAVGSENFDAWADLDGSNAITTRRMYGAGFDDATARVSSAGTVGWYGTDRLGSVRKVIDNSGSVVASSDFDAFGNLKAGSLSDRYGFTGREWDSTLGLYDFRARPYSPAVGRFFSEDPMGFGAGDANLHRYVGNAATVYTDPSGLEPDEANAVAFTGAHAEYDPSSILGGGSGSSTQTVGSGLLNFGLGLFEGAKRMVPSTIFVDAAFDIAMGGDPVVAIPKAVGNYLVPTLPISEALGTQLGKGDYQGASKTVVGTAVPSTRVTVPILEGDTDKAAFEAAVLTAQVPVAFVGGGGAKPSTGVGPVAVEPVPIARPSNPRVGGVGGHAEGGVVARAPEAGPITAGKLPEAPTVGAGKGEPVGAGVGGTTRGGAVGSAEKPPTPNPAATDGQPPAGQGATPPSGPKLPQPGGPKPTGANSVDPAVLAKESNAEFSPPFVQTTSHPKLPHSAGKANIDKTQGIFEHGGATVKLESKTNGPGQWFEENLPGGKGSGMTRAVTHVEGHAAGIMRKHGIMDADLHINYIGGPCPQFCIPSLFKLLPPGAKLRVHFPRPNGTTGVWEFTGGHFDFVVLK